MYRTAVQLWRSLSQDVFNAHGVRLVSPHYITLPPELVQVSKERETASQNKSQD